MSSYFQQGMPVYDWNDYGGNKFDASQLSPEAAQLFSSNPSWGYGQLANNNVQQVQAGIDAFKAQFKNVTGRDPTSDELGGFAKSALYPAWNAPGDLQYTDQTALSNNYIQSNFDLNKLQQDKGNAEAPKQYGAVDQAFQSSVGRTATQEEKDHFGKLLANGSMDAYGLNQWLGQLPENIKKQDAEFQNSLRNTMQTQDARYFNEQIMPGIGQSFAKQGRSFDSSAYASALARAAQGQNTQREGFLNNLSASQYQGNKTNAYDAYLNSVGRYQQSQDYARNRYDQLTDVGTQRLIDTQNFNMQKSAYDDYLRKYGKRNTGSMSGIGSLAGMGIGAILAAPTGGMSIPAGAMLGGMMGGSGGSIMDSMR